MLETEAFEKPEMILRSNRNIDGAIAGNDTMAVGAAAAIRNAGRKRVVDCHLVTRQNVGEFGPFRVEKDPATAATAR